MALSDCEKCWDTPCICGWEYREWTLDYRLLLAAVVLGVHPDNLRYLFDNSNIDLPYTHPKLDDPQWHVDKS